MIARTLAAALLGFALLAAGAADPPAPAASSASTRDAIYFGPAGPVRIRLNVSIDGRPADAVWAEAIDALFVLRDANGDGVLDEKERAPFVAQRVPRELEVVFDGRTPLELLRLTFNPKDKDKVTKAAFADAVKSANRPPVTLRFVSGRADSKPLSTALFKHLDQTGDGRLSPDELKAARERLANLDVDEDEFFTTAELLGRAVGANNPRQLVFPGMRQPEETNEISPDLLFLTADGPQAVKQLLVARGNAKATSLRAADIGADAKTFAALDQDGNGVLDTTELTAWLRKPADLELTIAFDAGGGKLTSAAHAVDKSGGASVALPGGRFRFDAPFGPPSKDRARAADDIAAWFTGLAKGAGAVERKQLEGQPAALAFFEIADRNADGKVDAAELAAAAKALSPLARCRVDVAFVDQGNGLFELLDRNGDGRLAPRELVDAVAGLKPFAAADGSVGPKDLVRQFQVRTALDPIPVGALVGPARPVPVDEPVRSVPTWFTKMDRNSDGDVSLKEFVGPLELFRKLDRDGDGLISPAEAGK